MHPRALCVCIGYHHRPYLGLVFFLVQQYFPTQDHQNSSRRLIKSRAYETKAMAANHPLIFLLLLVAAVADGL